MDDETARQRRRERDRRYAEAHREEICARSRAYAAANREKIREQKRASDRRNAEKKRLREATYRKKNREVLREALLDLLGRQCVRCGFEDVRALCIDHVNGGGEQARRQATSIDSYYRAILEAGGAGHQILCCNCNAIKRIERGEHPKPRGLPPL